MKHEESKTARRIFLPNPGQEVGSTGNQLTPNICKSIIEAVKSGDKDKLHSELGKYNIEIRDVVDHGNFLQNLVFTACQCPDEEKAISMIELMVNMGVDWKKKDNLNQTPLFYSSKMGYCNIINVLVENGFSVDHIDTYGQNAIYYAVNANQFEAVKLLKELGSDHDKVDENGQTPLYYAIKQNKPEIIEYLLQQTCKLENVDKRGQTPISFAVRH